MTKTIFLKAITGLVFLSFLQCNKRNKFPIGDFENGGLFLPDYFEALVVTDSIGSTRHIAVNDNGDIYAQLNN